MNTNQVSHITTDGTPLRFVYMGTWHLLTGWHSVSQSDQECHPLFGWFCFFPVPNHFLFRPRSSFRAALTLTLQTTEEKTHQKNWHLCRLTDGKGKGGLQYPCLFVEEITHYLSFIIEHFDMKLTGSSMIPQELGISCFSKWVLL